MKIITHAHRMVSIALLGFFLTACRGTATPLPVSVPTEIALPTITPVIATATLVEPTPTLNPFGADVKTVVLADGTSVALSPDGTFLGVARNGTAYPANEAGVVSRDGTFFVYNRETGTLDSVPLPADATFTQTEYGWVALDSQGVALAFLVNGEYFVFAPDGRVTVDDIILHWNPQTSQVEIVGKTVTITDEGQPPITLEVIAEGVGITDSGDYFLIDQTTQKWEKVVGLSTPEEIHAMATKFLNYDPSMDFSMNGPNADLLLVDRSEHTKKVLPLWYIGSDNSEGSVYYYQQVVLLGILIHESENPQMYSVVGIEHPLTKKRAIVLFAQQYLNHPSFYPSDFPMGIRETKTPELRRESVQYWDKNEVFLRMSKVVGQPIQISFSEVTNLKIALEPTIKKTRGVDIEKWQWYFDRKLPNSNYVDWLNNPNEPIPYGVFLDTDALNLAAIDTEAIPFSNGGVLPSLGK